MYQKQAFIYSRAGASEQTGSFAPCYSSPPNGHHAEEQAGPVFPDPIFQRKT